MISGIRIKDRKVYGPNNGDVTEDETPDESAEIIDLDRDFLVGTKKRRSWAGHGQKTSRNIHDLEH